MSRIEISALSVQIESASQEELAAIGGDLFQALARQGRNAWRALEETLQDLEEDDRSEIASWMGEIVIGMEKQLAAEGQEPGQDQGDELEDELEDDLNEAP